MRAPLSALASVVLLAVLSCDNDPQGMRIEGPSGTLRVTVIMSGSLPDADGITVAVDGGTPYTVVRGIAILFPRLPAGAHRLELDDVAENCAAPGGNPLIVTVLPHDTIDVEIVLLCPDPSAGSIRVGTSVRDFDLDPDGYAVRVDDGPGTALAAGGVTLLSDVAPGEHTVHLDDVDEACTVEGTNPRFVAVSGRDTADVHFALTCGTPGTGSIWLTAATPGIDRFSAGVEDESLEDAGPSGVVVLHGLQPGTHRLWLRITAEHCSIEGDNPRDVSVEADRLTRVAFDVACEPGSLLVRVSTTGSSLPDGFDVFVIESGDYYCYYYTCRSRRFGANGIGRFDRLSFVDHDVWIRLPARCTAPTTYHQSVAVASSGVSLVRFDVTCR